MELRRRRAQDAEHELPEDDERELVALADEEELLHRPEREGIRSVAPHGSAALRCGGERLALLTVDMPEPTGYGRIIRAGESVQAIVEEKDASDAQRAIREVYTGFMAVPGAMLKRWLGRLTNDNAQGEYYLTDIVGLAVQDGTEVVAVHAPEQVQVDGVNSPVQLAALERAYQLRYARRLMDAGVRIADPARLDVRGVLECR